MKRLYQVLFASTYLAFFATAAAAQAKSGASGKPSKPKSQIVVRPGPPVKPTGPAKPVGNQKSDWGDSSTRKARPAKEK